MATETPTLTPPPAKEEDVRETSSEIPVQPFYGPADTAGIDYTAPDVARVLARDGEGELIGWDFVDNDHRPYAAAGGTDDTQLAKLFSGTGLRMVPIRADLADPLSLARGAAFAGKTPASIVIVPVVSRRSDDLVPLRTVAQHLKDTVFVVLAAGAHRAGSARRAGWRDAPVRRRVRRPSVGIR